MDNNDFKNRLKSKKEGLCVNASPLDFLRDINEQLTLEMEANKALSFKKNLNKIKSFVLDGQETSIGISEIFTQNNTDDVENILEIIQINDPPDTTQKEQNFIENVVDFIAKEQNHIDENTNLFSEPDIQSTKNLKEIQTKLKFLESWISKISMTGPGSGEVNFRWLDDVNRNTIGHTDQILRYNPDDKKFFFGQLSGDQGPIRSLEFVSTGAGITANSRTLDWNSSKDCLNVYQNDSSILQVGLESYIRVHNSTANTLTNGTFVQFSGVNGDGETPTCVPFVANSNSVPLYTIGVLTNDIPSGQNGRATTLGEIRNLNTTGDTVGEVWNAGDLLWASPINPGKLTKVRPTAPNVVVSVAVVLVKDNVNGILLVRPIIFPRLYYGSFYDTTNQTANNINTPVAVKYSNTSISSGFYIANTTQIVAQNAGLYNYQFSLQVQSDVSADNSIWIWYRKNGQDVPHSSTRISVNKQYKCAAWNFIESMEIGEFFELYWAVSDTAVAITAPASTAFCPATPSVILTVTQANL